MSIVSATIAVPAAVASALVVLTFHMLPGLEAPHVAWNAFVPALSISILHIAAMALAIHHAPVAPSVRPIFLIAMACALPALAPTAFAPIALLRAAEHTFPTPITDDWAAPVLEFVPILAWLAAALLLQVLSNRRA